MIDLDKMGQGARQTARVLAGLGRTDKDRVINRLADLLDTQQARVLAANDRDIALAEADGLAPALIDRLRLNTDRLAGIMTDLRRVSQLEDPVGTIFDRQVLPNGLRIHKQRVPIGVLGVIYESRPNVTLDVASLALKSGNAVILRGGKETLHTNRALVSLIHEALADCKLPVEAVQFINSVERAHVLALLHMHDTVDMLIPRGGAGLHQFCRENSRIPVIMGGIGVCHLFVDESADLGAALDVIHNAKTQRPTVCNALDTVLVHQKIARDFIPALIAHLEGDGVCFRLDPGAFRCAAGSPDSSEAVTFADAEDFGREWLSLTLGVGVVADLTQAIEHIHAHSTGHSDGILTQDNAQAELFVQAVDSAAVYVNASTRFTDGGQLGLGAEVAISTQRLHARGPMALEALTTYKWVIWGENHTRPD